jgi:hypothetical protein
LRYITDSCILIVGFGTKLLSDLWNFPTKVRVYIEYLYLAVSKLGLVINGELISRFFEQGLNQLKRQLLVYRNIELVFLITNFQKKLKGKNISIEFKFKVLNFI